MAFCYKCDCFAHVNLYPLCCFVKGVGTQVTGNSKVPLSGCCSWPQRVAGGGRCLPERNGMNTGHESISSLEILCISPCALKSSAWRKGWMSLGERSTGCFLGLWISGRWYRDWDKFQPEFPMAFLFSKPGSPASWKYCMLPDIPTINYLAELANKVCSLCPAAWPKSAHSSAWRPRCSTSPGKRA